MYSNIEPYNKGHISVSKHHCLYFEECGNPKGQPIVFLHGGPGGNISPFYRRLFHPQKFRTILFDQRGSGQSIPFASLEENTTQHLVEDIEVLRNYFGIEKWMIMGGSWGSTLAVAYAIKYPSRVQSMILRGIFLASKSEIAWLYGPNGAALLFPEMYERYRNYLQEHPLVSPCYKGIDDIIPGYYELLTHIDVDVQREAAYEWNYWETSISQLQPYDIPKYDPLDDSIRALARIEAHFFINNTFLPQSDDNVLLEQAKQTLQDIPISIINGRYDAICPSITAYELHKAIPNSRYIIAPTSGHSTSEPEISKAIISEILYQHKKLHRK